MGERFFPRIDLKYFRRIGRRPVLQWSGVEMGNQFSHCSNTTAACFDLDVNDTRMELRDSGEAPEQQRRTEACGRHTANEDRAGQSRASPRGNVGRNHSVQRSFGGSIPGTPRSGRGGLSDADLMLEELRKIYSTGVCTCGSVQWMRTHHRARARTNAVDLRGGARACTRAADLQCCSAHIPCNFNPSNRGVLCALTQSTQNIAQDGDPPQRRRLWRR